MLHSISPEVVSTLGHASRFLQNRRGFTFLVVIIHLPEVFRNPEQVRIPIPIEN